MSYLLHLLSGPEAGESGGQSDFLPVPPSLGHSLNPPLGLIGFTVFPPLFISTQTLPVGS